MYREDSVELQMFLPVHCKSMRVPLSKDIFNSQISLYHNNAIWMEMKNFVMRKCL